MSRLSLEWGLFFHTLVVVPLAPSKSTWLNYSLGTPVIVIVIVALAEELLALLTLLVAALSRTLVSAIEKLVSPKPNRINPPSRVARMTTKNGVLTSTPLNLIIPPTSLK
jgi:hypothetical protein